MMTTMKMVVAIGNQRRLLSIFLTCLKEDSFSIIHSNYTLTIGRLWDILCNMSERKETIEPNSINNTERPVESSRAVDTTPRREGAVPKEWKHGWK